MYIILAILIGIILERQFGYTIKDTRLKKIESICNDRIEENIDKFDWRKTSEYKTLKNILRNINE